MGQTFHTVCDDCRVHLWVGQNSAGRPDGWLYTNNAQQIWKFLMEHRGHKLRFLEAQEIDIDYADIEEEQDLAPPNPRFIT